MNKHKWRFLPKQILWRLTLTNIVVIAFFIILSTWAIYNTACFLADGMGLMTPNKQGQFNSTLFQYLWIFSVSAIVIGSFIHFYVTKKLIRPLRKLIESTKRMKQGDYPDPIEEKFPDETGQLIGHFNDLIQQLKDNQAHRQKLVSDLSHELRTPLSNLNGYLSALKSGVITGDLQLYQSLYEEVSKLTNMVEQLDQLKEWDYVSKQRFLEKESIDIVQLIEQAVRMFQWSLKRAGIQCEIQMEPGTVTVNREAISQVISNLLDNAIRYYQGEGPIAVKGKRLESVYEFTITGPGKKIPEAEQAKIFERFYRLDPSRARATGGTGLGLAISKEIVEQHQGKIGIRSTGEVHTFWFSLPVGN
ncbi:ATP-binding protein [Virgibacillus sp. 179-BFC.A HS]|uniref:histidine kinase n=1 Tax=Tigheibacillus jepli TaxID=3035914 RepID=A0ABU5CKW8_9BACI|nr:ATP-binding protein [Virgibacillus sp. 179-BFC.A HS]MDY0406482.1 ATP-binding protein [Virgibacillus sp. 179-BFC.A HS]